MQTFRYRVYTPGEEGDMGAGEINTPHMFLAAVTALSKHSDIAEHAFGDFEMTVQFADQLGDLVYTFTRANKRTAATVVCVCVQPVIATKAQSPTRHLIALQSRRAARISFPRKDALPLPWRAPLVECVDDVSRLGWTQDRVLDQPLFRAVEDFVRRMPGNRLAQRNALEAARYYGTGNTARLTDADLETMLAWFLKQDQKIITVHMNLLQLRLIRLAISYAIKWGAFIQDDLKEVQTLADIVGDYDPTEDCEYSWAI